MAYDEGVGGVDCVRPLGGLPLFGASYIAKVASLTGSALSVGLLHQRAPTPSAPIPRVKLAFLFRRYPIIARRVGKFARIGAQYDEYSLFDAVNCLVGSPPSPTADQQGGGVWARAMGGTVDTQNSGVVGRDKFPRAISQDWTPYASYHGAISL